MDTSISIGSIALISTIVFVILKLTGVVTWAWWLVFLPLMISAGLGVVGLVILSIYFITQTWKNL